MNTKPLLILLLILISGVFYYNLTGNTISNQETITTNVTRIIDGDTIETQLGNIRLLGINTPEKSQPYYQEAKDFLKDNLEGKQVELELQGKDKYSRYLGYAFYNNKLINEEIIKQGLATLYYYGTDSHKEELTKAEESARLNNLGLWKKSSNFSCIKLISLEYKDEGNCKNQEQLILDNSCTSLNIIIKDDANHIYKETLKAGLFIKNYSCIWNDAGDSIYIRDQEGLLLFYRY